MKKPETKFEVWWNDPKIAPSDRCRVVRASQRDRFIKTLIKKLLKKRIVKKDFKIYVSVRPELV